MSQADLAARMTERGRPLSRPALQQLETSKRGVSLDEALALAACLWAAPANLLSPPGDTYVALTDDVGVDGQALRTWFSTGDPLGAWPETPTEDDRAALDEILGDALSRLALALVDANRSGDKAGVKALYVAIEQAVDRHRAALRAIETGEDVEGPSGRIARRTRPRKRGTNG
jgi:transcriptional regulator with XRE-family HTH domain